MDSKKLMKLNNGFGPISEKRGDRSYYATIVFGIILIVIYLAFQLCFEKKSFSDQVFDVLMSTGDLVSALITGELFRRALLYSEEYYHVNERYLGSKFDAFKSCVVFSNKNVMVLLIWSITSFTYIYKLSSSTPCLSMLQYGSLVILNSVGVQLLGLRDLSAVELSELSEKEIKNVAVGLAWSYYFGYLKLMLPGWESMLERAIGPQFVIGNMDTKVSLASNKLFIVMPKNCYCYESFQAMDTSIEFSSSMPEIKKARGGVQERVYKSSLYRIQKPGEDPKYVMMEYATPLLSFYDMKHESNAAFFGDKDLQTQVVIFYNTLKDILDSDPECRGKYQLVLVSDVHKNLSDVILKAITDERLNMCDS